MEGARTSGAGSQYGLVTPDPGSRPGGETTMRRSRQWGLRALAVTTGLGLATGGLLATSAGAQSASSPGVTAKDITLGYISSETGVAASASKGSETGCK